MGDALRVNASVTSFNLAGNGIEAEGAWAMAAVLAENDARGVGGSAALTELNLAVNNLGPEGAKALSEVAPRARGRTNDTAPRS